MSVAHKISDDQYAQAHEALERVRKLPENWDGEGAPRPSKDAVDRAMTVVGILRHSSVPVPAPCVAAMRDGGVQLAWMCIAKEGRLEMEARLQDEGDELMIGYAHVPGFEFNEQVDGAGEIVQRVIDRFKQEAT